MLTKSHFLLIIISLIVLCNSLVLFCEYQDQLIIDESHQVEQEWLNMKAQLSDDVIIQSNIEHKIVLMEKLINLSKFYKKLEKVKWIASIIGGVLSFIAFYIAFLKIQES